jgi:hypothetical protein
MRQHQRFQRFRIERVEIGQRRQNHARSIP